MKRSVKTLTLSVIGAALVAQVASANTVIADNMKQIGALVKSINAAAANPSENPQSASEAAQLIPLFQAVQNVVPDAIVTLPAAQQAAATADYKALIQKEIEDATTLQNDFQTGNNADALKVLKDMNSLKVTGHTKYNPQS